VELPAADCVSSSLKATDATAKCGAAFDRSLYVGGSVGQGRMMITVISGHDGLSIFRGLARVHALGTCP
jgi:hypothetical protein